MRPDLDRLSHLIPSESAMTRWLQDYDRQTVEIAIGLLMQTVDEVNESLNDELWDLCHTTETTVPETWTSVAPVGDDDDTIPSPTPESGVQVVALRAPPLPIDLMQLVMEAEGDEVDAAIYRMLARQS